ncbi:MAG: CAP domain-containing protein [Tateyamaria sp.]|uniref:CAP domain-containing protein n=1 Tax=Tateyamaria sp. TaxID=1929288 RepID=UPI003274CDDE
MPPILNLILVLFGGGALAAAGRGGSSSATTAPAQNPIETDPVPAVSDESDDTPPEEDPPAASNPPPTPVAEAPVSSDAPDLPDSAYDLDWAGLTAQEQYMLELVNRARLDPEAEEIRTGDAVDSGVSTAPKQALAVHPILSATADNHSADMLDRDFFAHTNPDGDGPTDRAQDEGWSGRGVWENISARWTSAASVSDEQSWIDESHAGLWESDGHQFGMLQDSHTVAGIGVDWGEWSYPGPTYPTAMVVTEKFSNDDQTYLTGVVIDDADNDDFYDIGEGQGGVHITAWQGEDVYTTSTWDSGGYSLALDAGVYNVRFEGGDLNTAYEMVVNIGDENVKLDVFENDLDMPVVAMSEEMSSIPDEGTIENLFLSAEESLEMIEREAEAVRAFEGAEGEDELVMV